MNLLSTSGMSNIFTRLTNVRRPLKSFNSLVIAHTVPRSRDNTHCVWFNVYRPEKNILQKDDIIIACRKGFILTSFNNNFLMHIMPVSVNWHRPSSRLRAIVYCKEFCRFTSRTIPKFGLAHHLTCSLFHRIGFKIKAHRVQILCHINKIRGSTPCCMWCQMIWACCLDSYVEN